MLRTATLEEIKRGKVTDVYFERTKAILELKGIHKKVVAEFAVRALPGDIPWAIFSGLSDVLELLEGLPVKVDSIPEGTVFIPDTPVMSVIGDYLDFGVYETSILGLICQASGVATHAARCANAAQGRSVLAFGTRRMHPALAPILDRNAYIGGCSGISTVLSSEVLNIPASGTIPHALILLMGDTVEATAAFDEIISKKVPRISLIDTFNDEKFEALNVAESLKGKLYGIRLDTPTSRRGDFRKILEEVRWELDIRGFEKVKILVSGGLDVDSILELNEFADAYGVGTSISNAPVIDFSMDIVEIDGKPEAKRGKMSGQKEIFIGKNPTDLKICLKKSKKPSEYRKITRNYMEQGKITATFPGNEEIRNYVLSQIKDLTL